LEPLQRKISRWKSFQYGYFQFADHFLGRKLSFRIHQKARRRYYAKLHKQLKAKGKGQLHPIDRRADLSIEDFKKEYVRKGIPVVLEGAAKEWACVQKWSLDYFKEQHGDDEIVFVDQHKLDLSHETLTLADVIDGIRDGMDRYYRFYPLLERHPEHLADFDYKWLMQHRHKRTVLESFQVFIGGAGSYTPIHNASPSNLFTQVVGEKEWILYPNHYIPVVDPDPVRNIYRNAPPRIGEDAFNPFKPDYGHSTALYEYIDGYKVHLKPGDVLYNPCYYWHSVQNIGDSIGVGYRWLNFGHNFGKHRLYTLLDLCVTKPPFWKTWKLSRVDVNLLHLAETGQLKAYQKEQRKK